MRSFVEQLAVVKQVVELMVCGLSCAKAANELNTKMIVSRFFMREYHFNFNGLISASLAQL